MEKIFYPDSLVIIGLSSRAENLPRMILENLLRWGYRGKVFGLNPRSEDAYVDGIKMYKNIDDLPQIPDLAVCLIPARFIPEQVECCGKFGIKRMAIPSGGFSEFSEEGKRLSELTLSNARKYGIRFVGPNGFTVANRANGLCLLFVPFYPPPLGEISIISQSGGLGATIWNPFIDEQLGMAKFASVGNKLDLDEVDFLEYFGKDPDTKIIFMYLENIQRGKDLVHVASAIDKPIIVLKSNTTPTGSKAAMSHTAALSNDEDVIDTAFEKTGIIRIHNFRDFIAMAKAFKLPPMQGNRVMVMSPAGGFAVTTADLCVRAGFEFADPGEDFFQSLKNYSKAGVIRFSNPLDMGDIYDPAFTALIFSSVLHNKNIDCALYVSHWPHMPAGDDVFSRMLHADLSKDTWGAILSSGKPVGVCLLGISQTITKIKKNVNFPVFNSPEEMVRAIASQRDFYARKATPSVLEEQPSHPNRAAAQKWITTHQGVSGEETLFLLSLYGIPVAESLVARDENEAIRLSERIGYPVVMKVVSPDAIHKSEAQGVMVNIKSHNEVKQAFLMIKKNLAAYKPDAEFHGVGIQKMASDGYDMFIGGKYDAAFGPVVYFGLGGIYVEIFKDLSLALCPSSPAEIETKVKKLKSYPMLKGSRGKPAGDIQRYIDSIIRISHLLADFPQIKELDINPFRILSNGTGVVSLDARIRTE
ncbi:MAG TPA: acetate--CoA ligase family protein [Thermodesulfobacteriota bacterium]|nr:acetate--CoA ligase family protein [Thermodesulfobacteriota bacterium]